MLLLVALLPIAPPLLNNLGYFACVQLIYTALIIAITVVAWLVSGQINQPKKVMPASLAIQNSQFSAAQADETLTRVRAEVIHAEVRTAKVMVRGQTRNKRTVMVKAETRSKIVSRPVERGDRVAKGDLLCKLAVEDRWATVLQAKAGLNHAQINFDGSLKLQKRGLQSETAIASIKADLARAEADLSRARLEMARTEIRAPFAGVIEDTHAETGDYLQPGAGCITLIDLDPMLLVGQVAERNVHKLSIGAVARGVLADGKIVEGRISFIGNKSNERTRTYAIEVAIPNSDYAIKSGYTAQIEVAVHELMAHQISPALLSLDDEGNIGVRTIDNQNRVVFNLVEIVADDPQGIWITGIPDVATLITVGQELVVPGEEVEISYQSSVELPIVNKNEATGGALNGAAGTAVTAQSGLGLSQ